MSVAELTLDVFSLADHKVDDIQLYYASRSAGLDAAEGRHVCAGEPP